MADIYNSSYTGQQVDQVITAWVGKINTETAVSDSSKKQALVYKEVESQWKWVPEDLKTNFYTEEEVNTQVFNLQNQINNKVTKGGGNGNYFLSDQLDTTGNPWKDLTETFYTKLEVYTKEQTYNKEELYNKTETDLLLEGKSDKGTVDILIEGIKKLADATVLVDEVGNPFEDENGRYFVPEYVDKWARAEILKLKEGN